MGYKYEPEYFQSIGLEEDFVHFYRLFEIYQENKNDVMNKFYLKEQWQNMFFWIKAEVVTGRIDPITAKEIYDYLEELVND